MVSCPICTEDYSASRPGKVQRCCGSNLCQNCLYSHIKSILEEGITGAGRQSLSCPFGCGQTVSDQIVRESFRAKNTSFLRLVVGLPIYNICLYLGCFQTAIYFWRFSQAPSERNDLQLYEKWSLTTALSYRVENKSEENKVEMDANHVYVHVTHCPRPNCECLWLSHEPYRKKKLKHERQYNNKKRHDEAPASFSKSLMLSFSSVFFKPLPPEKEEAMMNKNGFTTDHWMNPIDVDVFDLKRQKKRRSYMSLNRRDENNDGRLVTCPSCDYRFCGLCSRPWTTLSNSSGIRVTHNGKLCSIYGQRASDDDDFLQAADIGDAKFCPGCSMRTNRTDGCNHSKLLFLYVHVLVNVIRNAVLKNNE